MLQSFNPLLEGYLPHIPDEDSHHHLLSVDRGMHVLLLVIAFDFCGLFSTLRCDYFIINMKMCQRFFYLPASSSNQNTSYPAAAATLCDAICDIPVP